MREGVTKHDIHIKPKSYKLELLGKLVVNMIFIYVSEFILFLLLCPITICHHTLVLLLHLWILSYCLTLFMKSYLSLAGVALR